MFDAKSFRSIGELSFKDDADNVRYDDSSKQIYVGFGNGGIGTINAADGKHVGSIELAGHPEAFVLEKNGKRIFVNVPTARHVAVIDRDKGAVIARWSTGLAFGNFPMALDDAGHAIRQDPPALFLTAPRARGQVLLHVKAVRYLPRTATTMTTT